MRNRMFFRGKCLLSLCMCSIFFNLHGQKKDSLKHRVYTIKLQIDLPVTTVAMATASWGWNIVNSKSPLDSLTIVGLDPNNINRFDRSATMQDVEFAPTARIISDVGLLGANVLPMLLLADKKIRQDWGPLLLLFLETQAATGNLYSWGSSVHIDRIRPLVYNPDVPWAERAGVRTQNAYYSGHTSVSASASFFTAKVYCDYHPELGNKKYLVYSLALIPPVFTGYFRYKAMKHFPTDVITGVIVGAGTGILIPYLHKITGPNLSVMPFGGQFNGLALSLRL